MSALHEALERWLAAHGGEGKRVLVLGGGDGLALREILKYKSVESVQLVDLDLSLRKKFFGREIFRSVIAGVGNTRQRFCGVVYEAAEP